MKAWELLDSPEKWTRGWYARTEYGDRTGANCVDATCWCMKGAITHCYPYGLWDVVIATLMQRLGPHFTAWNDAPSRTWEEVHAVLKELDI